MEKMKKGSSRSIVVDTSVARAAGNTIHPISHSCRNALIAILSICHNVVMTQAISSEWKKYVSSDEFRTYESKFVRKWWRSMAARKKTEDIPIGSNKLNSPDLNLLKLSNKDRDALKKDLLLIEAAACSDGIILTTDEEIIRIWNNCKNHFNCSKKIRWINPLDINCITTLESLSKNKFK
jgi:hypothetical protein